MSETCTLITTLLDQQAVSAEQIRGAYQSRWPASETTFGEDKTTITGAGDRTSGPVLRSGTPRLVIQEFWAWMTATQLVRASAAASLATEAAAARALRRREDSGPVTTDQVSFTTARHHAVCSMIQARVTAGTSLAALAALAEDTSRVTLHTLVLHRPAAPLPAGTESPARLPAYRGHQEDRHRHPAGDPVPARLGPSRLPAQTPSGRRRRPGPAGAAARGTARPPRRHAAFCHTPVPGNPPSTPTMRHLWDCEIITPQSGIDT